MDGYEAVSGRGGIAVPVGGDGVSWGAAESGSDGSARRGVGDADRAAGIRWRVCAASWLSIWGCGAMAGPGLPSSAAQVVRHTRDHRFRKAWSRGPCDSSSHASSRIASNAFAVVDETSAAIAEYGSPVSSAGGEVVVVWCVGRSTWPADVPAAGAELDSPLHLRSSGMSGSMTRCARCSDSRRRPGIDSWCLHRTIRWAKWSHQTFWKNPDRRIGYRLMIEASPGWREQRSRGGWRRMPRWRG